MVYHPGGTDGQVLERAAQPGDAGGGEGIHAAAHGSQRLDRAKHGWGADLGGGGELVSQVVQSYRSSINPSVLNPAWRMIVRSVPLSRVL
jgi:hypothetical protein